ncbi:hypothetical protein LMTR13_26260 [Bradyrhizobium icense]|uniref:Uncharacterized protein n=2 Tax=Bradyrhizobium icense TaxID=1274631 RepID=A0A1B1UJZ0_9BRAD|nr:hypothetical protein LMTR13_26260 [Bradyrhizobium icense]
MRIWVYRDLSNRLANEPDDGEMAWDAHRLRRKTLHELLDADSDFEVLEWDPNFDDEKSTHECGLLVLALNWLGFTTVPGALHAFLISVLQGVAVEVVIRGTGKLIAKLDPRMRTKEIGDAYIQLADQHKYTCGLTVQSRYIW